MKSATDRFAEAIEAAEMMFGEMLRSYVLSAGVCVLLGIGIGFGWHFVDRAGGRTVASAATPPAKPDAPNPPSSNPPAQREGPVLDVPRGSGLSDAQQPAPSMALDLSNEEKLALVTLLTRNIAQDRHQSSAQVRSLKHILLKLDPKPPAQPSLPPKVSAPPDAKRGSVRQREQRPNPSVPIADEIRARQ
ncbi:MAG TPA: hypothetical protein VNW89_03810 [Stellaceae bacterium]|nr:hypothetical protein [Stellaceae bacterium]